MIEDEAIEVGLGLRGSNILAARDKVESAEEAEPLQVPLDVYMAGIGGEPDFEPGLPSLVEGLPPQLEGLPISLGTEFPPWIERVVSVPDVPGEEGPVKGKAMGAVHVAVGVDQGGFRVENQAVEIKD